MEEVSGEGNNQQSLVASSIRDWLIAEYRKGKKGCKTSEAKDQFPTIHLKWIDLGIELLVSEGFLTLHESSSRIKTYDINDRFVPELPKAEPTDDQTNESKAAASKKRRHRSRAKIDWASGADLVGQDKEWDDLDNESDFSEEFECSPSKFSKTTPKDFLKSAPIGSPGSIGKILSPEELQAAAIEEIVCALLNDIFKLLSEGSTTVAAVGSSKHKLSEAINRYFDDNADVERTNDSIDKRFVVEHLLRGNDGDRLLTGHDKKDIVMNAPQVESALKDLETRNKIFIVDDVIYQI